MRIESIEFQQANGKKHQFNLKADRLNVIICKNEFAKNLVANAVLAALFGDARGSFSLSKIKLTSGEKQLLITRSFDPESLELTEFTDAGLKPIIAADLNGAGSDIGTALSGLNARVFSCVAMPKGEVHFTDPSFVSEILSNSNRRNREAENAIAAIDERLANYPFKGRTHKVDDLLSALARGRDVLVERVEQLEFERSEVAKNLAKLSQIDTEIELLSKAIKCDRLLKLRAELTELDFKIRKVQERILYETDLLRELRELGDMESFPIASLKKVEELWAKRTARSSDIERLGHELKTLSKDMEAEPDLFNNPDVLDVCTLEDAQLLFSLSRGLQSLQLEIEELQARRAAEMRRVKELGVDFDRVALVRKQLLAMNANSLQEANTLVSELKEGKEQLAGSVKETTRIETLLNSLIAEIERNSKRRNGDRMLLVLLLGFPSALLAASSLPLPMKFPLDPELALSARFFSGAFLLVAIVISMWRLLSAKNAAKEEQTRLLELEEEQKKHSQVEIAASGRVVEIQQKLDRIAAAYSMKTGLELSRNIQSYASTAMQLKELDLIDQMLISREGQTQKLQSQIEEVFERAGRTGTPITADTTSQLATEIQGRRERMREANKTNVIDHRKSEQRFLQGEIEDLDSQLRDTFYRARLRSPEDVVTSYAQFQEKVTAYRRWESIRSRLARLEQDRAVELMDADLSVVVADLQKKRAESAAHLQEMVSSSAEVARLSPDDAARLCAQVDMTIAPGRLEYLRSQQKEMTEAVRAASKNFDEFLPKTQHELEILDRDLERARHRKKAMELAKALLMRLASEGKSTWSEELSVISAELVQGAGLDLERLRWDEHLALRPTVRGSHRPIEDISGGGMSEAALAQLNLVARVAVARYVSPEVGLPLLLDEPFAQVDDESFESGMRMLLSRVIDRNQVVILTSHQVRHQWLLGKMSAEEKAKLHFAKV